MSKVWKNWFIHNVFAHPFMWLLQAVGLQRLGAGLHDGTCPDAPRYSAEVHVEWLRQMLEQDTRWLGHDPVARHLLKRYGDALRRDWYEFPHQTSSAFRVVADLVPDSSRPPPPPPPGPRLVSSCGKPVVDTNRAKK